MKHLLIAIAALLIAPAAYAADATPAKAGAEQVAASSTTTKSSPKQKAHAGKRKLPTGDLRRCLDMKTNEEIIKCSESR